MSKSFNHKNYSIISLIQWIPVSSTGKVSDSYIRDLDIYIYIYNAFLDTTWKGVYFLRKIFIVKKNYISSWKHTSNAFKVNGLYMGKNWMLDILIL